MIIALIVYAYDIVVRSDDLKEIEKRNTLLAKELEIKDLGRLKYF